MTVPGEMIEVQLVGPPEIVDKFLSVLESNINTDLDVAVLKGTRLPAKRSKGDVRQHLVLHLGSNHMAGAGTRSVSELTADSSSATTEADEKHSSNVTSSQPRFRRVRPNAKP